MLLRLKQEVVTSPFDWPLKPQRKLGNSLQIFNLIPRSHSAFRMYRSIFSVVESNLLWEDNSNFAKDRNGKNQ